MMHIDTPLMLTYMTPMLVRTILNRGSYVHNQDTMRTLSYGIWYQQYTMVLLLKLSNLYT